ncbi:MAG: cation transporter dimerization domain-containing protein [Thermoproteota archaeon]
MGGEIVVRVHTIPKVFENIYGIVRDSALRVNDVLNVHDILVSKVDDKLFVSLHIEVPESMSLSEAHRIADEVEEKVSRRLSGVENVMVHVETASSSIKPVSAVSSNSLIYLKAKEAVEKEAKQFHGLGGVKKIIVFRESSGLSRIELTVSMEGGRSMAEAHEATSRLEESVKNILGENFEVLVHVEPEDS